MASLLDSFLKTFAPRDYAMRQALDDDEKTRAVLSQIFGGTDPLNGITWNGGRQSPTSQFDMNTGERTMREPPRVNAAGLTDAQMQQLMTLPQVQSAMLQSSLGKLNQAPQLKEVGNSLLRVDPDMSVQELYRAPDRVEGFKVGATREFQRGGEKVTQEFDGQQWRDLATGPAYAPDRTPEPLVQVADPTSPSGTRMVPRSEAVNQPGQGTKFNNDQNKAAGYANSMIDAEGNIAALGGFNPAAPGEALMASTNATASKEYQKYKQAANDWALALLRFESGANVPESEAQKYVETYFPRFGDSEEVIKQKEAARLAKRQGVVAASGGAYDALRNKVGGQSANAAPPDAPREPTARKPNTVYNTPKGPLKWTGTGWVQP